MPKWVAALDQLRPASDAKMSDEKRDRVITPLINNIVGTGLTTQPDTIDVTFELNQLILLLTACATGPTPTCATVQRTEQITKAACAATVGSAITLLQ